MLPILTLAAVLAAASPARSGYSAAEPLQPLLSIVAATPYLHSTMAAQMDLLPWKTEDANYFLGGAEHGTVEREARLVMGALLSRHESFEHDYKQADRALGEGMSHGLRLRAGYFDKAVAEEVPAKKVIDGRKAFQWQSGIRPFKPRGPAAVVPLSSRRPAQ